MIKVENTRIHHITFIVPNAGTPERFEDILVADAELVLVERLYNYEGKIVIEINGKYYNPILISRTEKRIQGDWVLDYYCGKLSIFFYGRDLHFSDEACKILALPEHFSPEQLQMIVDGKLKEGKYLVECENHWFNKEGHELTGNYDGLSDLSKHFKSIKLNPHITIFPVQERVYTQETIDKLREMLVQGALTNMSCSSAIVEFDRIINE